MSAATMETVDQPSGELSARLASSNLSQYEGVLTKCGFDTWSSVLEISDHDLKRLQSELSRRRRLQRELISPPSGGTETRPSSPDTPLDSPRRRPTAGSRSGSFADSSPSSTQKSTKRRYRRHPKPDPNAPVRPKTAYVEFSDHIRSTHDISGLSFVDVAKYVGRLWRDLGHEGRGEREDKAAAAMILYRARLVEYKKTKEYTQYQEYLKSFYNEQAAQSTAIGKASGTEKRRHSRRASGGLAEVKSDDGFGPLLDTSESPVGGSGEESRLSSTGSSPTLSRFDSTLALSLASAMDVALRLFGTAPEGLEYFDGSKPPPKPIVSQVITAFISGTGAMFPIYSREELALMLNWGLDQKNPTIDRLLLMDLLVIVTVGGSFDYSLNDAHLQQSAFYSCLKLLVQSEGIPNLRLMRIFLCLSLYCTMQFPVAATQFTSAALQIGRLEILPRIDFNQNSPNAEANYWRTVFRTAVFIETWQSLALRRKSNAIGADLRVACHWNLSSCFIEPILQEEVSKIGLMMANNLKEPDWFGFSSPDDYGRIIKTQKQRLDTWHNELPCSVQLASLDQRNEAAYSAIQKRSIFNMHMFYFSTLIGLHRKLLPALAEYESSGEWPFPLCTLDQAYLGRDECEAAAQQLARVVQLQGASTAAGSQSWIIIYQAFITCAVLVHCAAVRQLQGYDELYNTDMTYAQACMELMSLSAPTEWFTARYITAIRPLFEEVNALSRLPQWAPVPPEGTMSGHSIDVEVIMQSATKTDRLMRVAKDVCVLLVKADGQLPDEGGFEMSGC